jgi:hypothetical protein
MATTPAGWHPDPWFPGQLRYWDGLAWTGHTTTIKPDLVSTRRWPWSRAPRPAKFKPSAPLVDATYRMLFADRSMIVLLFVGSVLAAAAAGVVAAPAIFWGHVTPTWSGDGFVGVLVAAVSLGASTFVIQLTTGAVVASAMLRAEGAEPTVRQALAVAWTRRRQILAWAAVSTVVGAVTATLQRMGIGGAIAALTANLGWAVATVFAMPVVIVEGTMPVATVRRSAQLLRATFGVTILSNVRLAIPWIVGAIGSIGVAVVGVGFLAFGTLSTAALVVGIVGVTAGVLGLAFCTVVSSALAAYLEAYLYRYATGLPVPGLDPQWLPPRSEH